MKRIFLVVLFLLFGFNIFNKKIYSAIKINEIFPAPSSGEYEWVELYNDENIEINLQGFYLLDAANNKIKIFAPIIKPFGFVIATSSSVLNNDNDTVYLKYNNQVVEIATYSGKFDLTKSYGKCPDGSDSWFVLNLPTKESSNNEACNLLTPTTTISSASSLIETPTPNITSINNLDISSFQPLISYEKIFISEAMVNPGKGENEWVEIYNGNDFNVFLNNWFIDDLENAGSAPRSFSLEIPSKGYGVVQLTNSIFNNSGDSVRLLDFNRNFKDGFEYLNTVEGKTWGRVSFDSDNFCLQEATKGFLNGVCINLTPTSSNELNSTILVMPITPTTIINKTPNRISSSKKINNLISEFNQQKKPLNYVSYQKFLEGEVLGEAVEKKKLKTPLVKNLSFLSFSYSFLVLISLFLKLIIKLGEPFFCTN